MKTTEFNKQFSSAKLKENLNKQFNTNVNLEQYGREKLEDMRNKLRTRIFQQEGSAGFNDLLTNETYQKNKAMLELLNTRIKEMLGEQMKQLRDKMDALNEAKKGTRPPKAKISAKGSKPDFLDMDKDGDKKEPMKKAVADKKAAPKKGVNPFAKKDEKVKEAAGKQVDMKGKKCTACKKGTYQETSQMDDTDGVLHCTKCKKEVKRHQSASVDESMFPGSPEYDEKYGKKGTGKFDVKDTGYSKRYTAKAPDTKDDDIDDEPKAKKAKKVKEGAKHPASCDCNECSTMEGLKGKQGKLDADKDGKLEKTDFAALRAKKKVKESSFKHNVKFVNESLAFLINEDEEGKAKAITAAGDMVNDFTSWMQRVGQYQTKTMIELADAIKADFGQAESEAFKQAVGPALSATLETLTQQREAVSNAVATLAGEAAPEVPMGADPMSDPMSDPMDPSMDMAGPDEMNPPVGDEFGASDAAAGGPETAGRAMRESNEQRRARKLSEAHSIMAKLAR